MPETVPVVQAELLPCPFCSCKRITTNNDGHCEWLECTICGATGPWIEPEPEHDYTGTELEDQWNTRLSPPADVAMLMEALEPFAQLGRLIHEETEGFSDDDELSLIVENGHLLNRFLVRDFRKARAALRPTAGEGA